jgi:hypothetical protein
VDEKTATACIAKTFDIMKCLASGQPRPVTGVLDDYDEFRRHVALLTTAGVLDEPAHQKTRRAFAKFIQQFHGNIDAIVTTRYNAARRDVDEAKTPSAKRIVVTDAAEELERLVQYPEHREHSLLNRVVGTLRDWEGKLGVNSKR